MRTDASGFSLIEVLVSVFVLAAGVIGAVAMQMASLQANRQSAYQSEAARLAADMAERIGAADVPADDGGNPYLRVDHAAGQALPPVPAEDCYGAEASCDSTQSTQFALTEWLNRLDAVLPGMRVRICRDAAPWDAGRRRYTWACAPSAQAPIAIKIGWRDVPGEYDAHEALDGDLDAPRLVLPVVPAR